MFKKLKETLDSPDAFVSLVLGLAVVLIIGLMVFRYIKGRTQPSTAGGDKKVEESTPSATPPTTHTVKDGETLWSIAETYYKNGAHWEDIRKANNLSDADALVEGQKLTIPAITLTPAPTGEALSTSTDGKPAQKTYTVVRGDTLWDIATRMYGNGYKWVDIAKANALANPDIIHAGNVFTLP